MTIVALVAARPLSRGAKGDGVALVQRALIAAGHELVVDGEFGPIVAVAVKRFQAAHGLNAVGYVGVKTAALLDTEMAKHSAPSVSMSSVLAAAPWLSVMRAITGTKELPGAADSPIIMSWRGKIIDAFPELAPGIRDYTHDSIPWCGYGAAYCMSEARQRPPLFPLYATNWFYEWDDGVRLKKPALGAALVKTRDGGGHVTLLEGQDASFYYCRGCNQSDMVNVTKIRKAGGGVLGFMWPKGFAEPSEDLPNLTFAEAVAAKES
jgi:uncharacterized protein (TIGR02594 family)